MSKKNFNVDCELDITHLYFILDELAKANSTDAVIIKKLQEEYEESSWFDVIHCAVELKNIRRGIK